MNRTSKKVDKAYQFSAALHSGKLRPDGESYFSYLEKICDMCRSENEKIVALLSTVLACEVASEHDIYFQFGPTVRDAVIALTRAAAETKECDFLTRLKSNPIARAVKIAEYKVQLEDKKITTAEFDDLLTFLIS